MDSVLYFTEFVVSHFDHWWDFSFEFFLGQSAVLGAWLAIGRLHRLARGAVFVGGLFLLTQVYIALSDNEFGWFWSNIVGIAKGLLSTCGFVTFIIALLSWVLFTKWSSKQTESTLVRYSIVELLGWTIVVALASIFMRDAQFWLWRVSPKAILPLYFAAIMCGLLARLADPKIAISLWQFALLVALEISCLFRLHYFGVKHNFLHSGYLPQVYFIAWLAVLRLDRKSQE